MPHNTPERNLSLLFVDLESAPVTTGWQGTTERRIASNNPSDLFVGVQKPANIRMLRARFRLSALPDPFALPSFSGLELSTIRTVEQDEECIDVVLRAPATVFNEVFTSLAEDIAHNVGAQTGEKAAAEVLLLRLNQWQRLLQRQAWQGLTPEEQRGLYGELCFLRDYLLPSQPLVETLSCWTGPEAANKDFQFSGNWAAEVKTSIAKQPQMLSISNERQLDDRGLDALYLVSYSIDVQHSGAETLPNAVEQVRALAANNGLAMSLFEDKLIQVGYLNAHIEMYRSNGYILRKTDLFKVTDGFPRIIEADLRPGVGNVRFGINVAACLPFAVDKSEIIQRIKEKS